MGSEKDDLTETVDTLRPVGGRAIASPTEPNELRAVFARDGVALVRGAFDPDQAAAMRQQFWRFVERHTQIREHDPASWPAGRGNLSMRRLRRDPVFGPFHSGPRIGRALDAVFGAGDWAVPGLGSQLLFTFPTPPPWVLPTQTWHIDSGFERPTAPVHTVKLFGLMDDVEPHRRWHLDAGGVTAARRFVRRPAADRHRRQREDLGAVHVPASALVPVAPWRQRR